MFPPKYAKPNGSHHEKVEGVSGNLLVVSWHPQGRSDEKHGKSYSQWVTPSPMQSSRWNEPSYVAQKCSHQPLIYAICWGWMESLDFPIQVVSLSIYDKCEGITDIGLKFHGLYNWPNPPHKMNQPWSASSNNAFSPNISSSMERLNSSTQVVSLSIYGMYGAAANLWLKFYGLQEWPKLPHQTNKPWSASSKNSNSLDGSSNMEKRDVVWQSWAAHCFPWNMHHVK